MITRYTTLLLLVAAATACSNDKDLKADLHSTVRNNINFAAVQYTVKDKEVTLTGTCPSEKTLQKIEQTVKGINLVKAVHNNIQIAPVTLTDLLPVQQSVDSVLAYYPMVTAVVTDTAIILRGQATGEDADKLVDKITKLHFGKVESQLLTNVSP